MSFKLFFTSGLFLGTVSASFFSYSCEGECYENCESKHLTPFFNNQDWFTEEVLRCFTHSPNATMKARVELDLKAVKCKSQNRAYFQLPVGMEDLWTLSVHEKITVSGPREPANVIVAYTNSEDPCVEADLNDKWAAMPIDNLVSPGQQIRYKRMVFDQLSDENLRHIKKATLFVDYAQEPLKTFQKDSWYMCEGGCCLDTAACYNSFMRERVTLDSFLNEAEACVAQNNGCKFTISSLSIHQFQPTDIFPCNSDEVALDLNLTTQIFSPPKYSKVTMFLSPSPERGHKVKASLSTQVTPCSSDKGSTWFDMTHRSDNEFEVTRVYNDPIKNVYGLLTFDNYSPYDIYGMWIPLHYGTLSDTKS